MRALNGAAANYLDRRRSTTFRLAALLLVSWALPVAAEIVDPNLWGADGNVLAIAHSGNTIYIAGSFRSVGPNSGGGVPVSERTGVPEPGFPRVTGSVSAVITDGEGGWFIGGGFSAVGGEPRFNLAHLLADGTIAPWAPEMELNHGVSSLVLMGRTLYVGGTFQTVNGQRRNHVAALDAESGELLQWDPNADQGVAALAAGDEAIYAGGDFYQIGGLPRSHIAALDPVSGAATGWNPGADRRVIALAVHGHTVYAGGYFFYMGGAARNLIAAVDEKTGRATTWDPHGNGPFSDYTDDPHVSELTIHGNTVYAVGQFDHIGGQARGGVAALDTRTGAATDWNPQFGPFYPGYAPPACEAVVVRGKTVYVGGWFDSVNGQDRPGAAALDAVTGEVEEWSPRPKGPVLALGLEGNTVYVGGEFGMIGNWRHRAGLAALDATTGEVKPWNPNPEGGIVTALAVDRGTVYVSGGFTRIGGQARNYFAALDTVNGEATPWDPRANDLATALLVHGSTVYAGGYFTYLGGQRRRYLAAVDGTTGAATAWNPDADYDVFSLALSGNTLYVGGFFDYVGGQLRKRIAAVDVVTGAVSSWNPSPPSGWVNSILVDGGTVYVGGLFHKIGGQSREGVAALDVATGTATAWNPHPIPWDSFYPEVMALALRGSNLYVGGEFASIGGRPWLCLAAVDTATGLATTWNPGADGYVWSLASSGDAVYAGGGFTRLGGLPCAGLAAIAPSEVTARAAPRPDPASLALIAPSPVGPTAAIRYSLPTPARVNLAVFDIQGRRMARVLHNEMQTAGVHDVSFPTKGWPNGFYFCRIDAGGASAIQKFVVLR